MMKKKKLDDLFSIPCGIGPVVLKAGAQWPTAKEYAELIKTHATADSKILRYLVQVYRQQIDCRAAERAFWEAVASLHLDSGEAECLQRATAGDLKAVQTLIKKNAEVIRLPFVQEAIIAFLQNHKYSLDIDLPTEKDRWCEFLAKRPKKKTMYCPENIQNLCSIIAKDKGKLEDYTTTKAAKLLRLSPSSIQKLSAKKGMRGRPKKKSR